MARIAGVNLPTGKHAEISLMYLYGVGRPLAQKILDKLKIERTRKIETLDETELDRCLSYLLRVLFARPALWRK